MEKIKSWIIIILSIILFFAILGTCNKSRRLKESDNLLQTTNDTLQTWKNKYGESLAKISVIETEKAKTFLELQTSNETIQTLQDLVKDYKKKLKNKGSATVIITETVIDTFVQTIVVVDSSGNIKSLEGHYKDLWVDIESISTRDTTIYNFKSFSEIHLVIGEEREGLFKKKSYAILHDKNPYTNIVDMRTYQVATPPPKRFGIGIVAGYGGLISQNGTSLGGFVGLGGSYNFIRF